jgi:hypothetical protein
MSDSLKLWGMLGMVLLCVGIFGAITMLGGDREPEFPDLGFVSGTEYNIGEAGQVIVEARFNNGSSGIAPPCEIKIWYPSKFLWIQENTTTSASDNEFINFTTPNVTGIYEYQAMCPMVVGPAKTISKSFHVSSFQNETSQRLNRMRAVMPK